MNSGWEHTSTISAEATGSIFLTETAGAANVVLMEAYGGDIRFTVRESALSGEDLNLLVNGSTLVDETSLPDPTTNFSRSVPYGRIAALNGWINLRVGDNVTTHDNSRILAGAVDRHLRRLPAHDRRDQHLRRLPGAGARPERHRRSGRRHGHEPARRDHARAC